MALDEEKLIILVSQYPEIYDLQNEHYMNITRKSNIWKEISEEIGLKDIVCKEKWKSLRDSYHRNLKKRKFKSGDGATKNKKWKYEHQMEFLQPYLQERTTKSNIENIESITSDDNTNENSLPDLMATSPEPVNSPLSSSSATSLMYKNISARKKNQTPKPTQKLSVAGALQNYLASRPATTTPTTMESSDPIHSFFRAMADSVKALPTDLQLKAKNKIYAIVSDLEYDNLLRNSTSSIGQAAAVTKKYSRDDSNKQFLEPTSSTFGLNKQLLEPTPSTSGLYKQFLKLHTTSRSRPQDIQVQQVQIAPDNFQHQLGNISDNESQSILKENSNTQTRYIITSDGLLTPQEVVEEKVVYEYEE